MPEDVNELSAQLKNSNFNCMPRVSIGLNNDSSLEIVRCPQKNGGLMHGDKRSSFLINDFNNQCQQQDYCQPDWQGAGLLQPGYTT